MFKKQKEKKIIFLIHLTRKVNNNNKESLQTEELISNLDDSYDHVFIDNLNNKDDKFTTLLDNNSIELLESIIDYDSFFDNKINEILSYIDYKFKNNFINININEYTRKVLDKIKNKNANAIFLKEQIKKIIKNNMNKNLVHNIFTTKIFQKSDIDFYHTYENCLKSEFYNILFSIVFHIEKLGFFSCLFITEHNKEILENEEIIKDEIIKKIFKEMNINSINKPQRQLRFNRVEIIIGLSIPSSHKWFNDLNSQFLKEEKMNIKYMNNENMLRARKENEDEEKYEKKYKQYINGLKFYEKKEINIIFNSQIENIRKVLLYDYFKYYLAKIYEKFTIKNEKFINPIEFIELLLQIRFNLIIDKKYQEKKIEFKKTYYETKQQFDLENFAEVFLFLECYEIDITFLTEVFCILHFYLSSDVKPIFNEIKKIISSRADEARKIDVILKYTNRVNETFYILIESFIKLIYIYEDKIFTDIDFSNFFDTLKTIEIFLDKICKKLIIFSDELITLKIILSLYDIFKNENDIKDIMKKILEIIKKTKKNDFNNLKEKIISINNIIIDKYGKDSDIYADYMSYFLRQQYEIYEKILNKFQKCEILEMAFENDKLIQRSLFFIHQSLKIFYPIFFEKNKIKKKFINFKPSDEEKKYTFENKEECEKFFLNFINKKNNDDENSSYEFYEKKDNEYLNQILLYYFEIKAYNYFENIKELYKEQEINKKLLLGLNLDYLRQALSHIDKISHPDFKDDSFNKLGKIYSIAYIKLYIKNFVKIYNNNKEQISFKEIIEVISSTNHNTRNIVKYFLFKSFLKKYDNYSKFEEAVIKDNSFPFRKEILDNINGGDDNKNNYILNYHMIIMENFEKIYWDNYLNFNVNLKVNHFKELRKFINNDRLDLLFCLSVNHLLSYYFSSQEEKKKNIILSLDLKNEFMRRFKNRNRNISEISQNLLSKLYEIENFIKYVIKKKMIIVKTYLKKNLKY